MKKTRILAWLLAVSLLQQLALTAFGAVQTGLEGKTLSILGDSISTYAGVSNNGSRNSTISRNLVYYTPGMAGVYQEDTWWQQTVDDLGLKLLVNNSWTGSCMYMEGAGTRGAYEQRCVQLHSNKGAPPDIIAVYMGTNDQDYFADTLGTYDAIDFDKLILPKSRGYAYAQPQTCMEAYAIALHKMTVRYPKAEIYCFTLLQRPKFTPFSVWSFNAQLKQLAEHFGVFVVELDRCGVMSYMPAFHLTMDDMVHPNVYGMDAITGAFSDALLTNSRYVAEDVQLWQVAYDLEGVAARQGMARVMVEGMPFQVDLVGLKGDGDLTVTVTMGGEDLTAQAWKNGTVRIEAVTGDLKITAKAVG